jgi:hypothetical protein
LPQAEHDEDDVPPPIFGDQEMVFGYLVAAFALMIENAKFVAGIVEV